MSVPDDLQYTEEHEWVRTDSSTLTVGITAHAAEALGDIVFVELPSVGDTVTLGHTCGEIESTKSVSDLFAPVSGTVVQINEVLTDAPETVGESPYEKGWLFRVEVAAGAAPDLLSAEAYRSLIGGGA